jgi:predicted transcriptional regulator
MALYDNKVVSYIHSSDKSTIDLAFSKFAELGILDRKSMTGSKGENQFVIAVEPNQ